MIKMKYFLSFDRQAIGQKKHEKSDIKHNLKVYSKKCMFEKHYYFL